MKKLLLAFAIFAIIHGGKAQSIYEIQGQTEQSPYNGQTVTTRGIVTATYSNSYFIQDGDSAWTGLYIYDQTEFPKLGDSILLTGTIEEYYDMTEMKNITSYTVLSSGNAVPNPILIATGDAQEKWESVFVKVENANCTNTDLGYGEWEINDGSGSVVVNDLGVAYTPIEGVSYNITGPLDFSFLFYKLEPRSINDIEQDLALYFKVNPYAENITKTSFDLKWKTNDLATSYVEYGVTSAYELGKASTTTSSTLHSITLDMLNAGTIYYAKAYSVNSNNDTTPVFTGVYVTQSESSGKIETYFNHEFLSMVTKSGDTPNIVDTIIGYINKAQTSMDIAIYDLTNHAAQSDSSNYKIIRAINNAYNRDVNIRLITDGNVGNYALDSLNAAIPLLKSDSDGIMHNKFLIIDTESVENAWVVTGSTNWTYNNLFMDFNNLVCIQDQSLAKAYELEFIEMWGDDSNSPNYEKSKFGLEKTDNTPHIFNINDVPVELYFSPSDKTTSKIITALDSAETDIHFAMMVFTENSLGTAMVNAKNRGVTTHGFIDYIESSGSEFDYLLSKGVDVEDFVNPEGGSWPDEPTLHHKFCVIDAFTDNALTITGTHNWSASAESKNDENTLFIYNQEVSRWFIDEYNSISVYLHGMGSVNEGLLSSVKIYPNPSEGNFTISIEEGKNFETSVYDMTGRLIKSITLESPTTNFSISEQGMYIIQLFDGINRYQKKIIVK